MAVNRVVVRCTRAGNGPGNGPLARNRFNILLLCSPFVAAVMAPKAVPSAATALRPLLWCLFTSKAQLLFAWTALTHLPLVVDCRRRQLLMTRERPLTAFLCPNIVPVVTSDPGGLFWCQYAPKEQSCAPIDGLRLT